MAKPWVRRAAAVLVAAGVAVFFSGCAGETNNVPGEVPQATWSSIQAAVFTPSCAVSGCHSAASAQRGLVLGDPQSQQAIGASSTEVPGLNLIEPGDPDNSYLIHKVEGSQAFGLRMPRLRPALTPETIQAMRDWIAAGALVP